MGRETAVRTGLVIQADWESCVDPEPLLHFLRDKGTNRKWRLFAVACCRRIIPVVTKSTSAENTRTGNSRLAWLELTQWMKPGIVFITPAPLYLLHTYPG